MSENAPRAVRTVVAENLRRIRKDRGATVRDLSNWLAAIGVDMPSSTVSECEQIRTDSNRAARKLSVEDLLSLSVALNVSPVDLLTPVEGSVSIASGVEPLHGFAMEAWLAGDTPWPPNADRAQFIAPASERRQRRDRAADRPEIHALDTLGAMVRSAIVRDADADPAALADALRREARRVSKYVALLADSIGEDDGR